MVDGELAGLTLTDLAGHIVLRTLGRDSDGKVRITLYSRDRADPKSVERQFRHRFTGFREIVDYLDMVIPGQEWSLQSKSVLRSWYTGKSSSRLRTEDEREEREWVKFFAAKPPALTR